jgi:hypothetical protein
MSWTRRASIAARRLQEQKDMLAAQLRCTREELQAAHRQRAGLEILLNTRAERRSSWTEQLTAEADHLAALFRETAVGSAPNK